MPSLPLIAITRKFPSIESQTPVANCDELGIPQRRENVDPEGIIATLEVSHSTRDALAILLEDQPAVTPDWHEI